LVDAFLFELWLCFPFLSFSLRFGWYGFNPGSTLTMKSGSDGALAAQVAMNTTLAAATGGITVFLLRDWAAVRHVETRNWYTE
jgi:ammonia channel protein AmtB